MAVLSVEFNKNLLRELDNFCGGRIFVPDKVCLDNLKHVHLSPRSFELSEELLRQEFDKYHPEYLNL
jgi:hypothetical protein